MILPIQTGGFAIAHFPKPFFKKARKRWYVEINRRQINLGSDRDEAFRRYHELMALPHEHEVSAESLAALVDTFLDWVKRNRAPDTFEWYQYRLERLVRMYPDKRAIDLKAMHVDRWVAANEPRAIWGPRWVTRMST